METSTTQGQRLTACQPLTHVDELAILLLCLAACRGLAQLLQVLDDTDLHQRQEPFTLGASRAIASTLNSLVFHTAFPEKQQRKQQQQQLSMPLLPATAAHGLVSPGVIASICTGTLRR